MLNEVIFLITHTGTEYDEDGFETDSEVIRQQVFAEVKTTTYKEFFEGARAGEQVTDVFVIGEDDYNNSLIEVDGKRIKPDMVEYNSTMYRIVRRYRRASTANYVIELTCREVE